MHTTFYKRLALGITIFAAILIGGQSAVARISNPISTVPSITASTTGLPASFKNTTDAASNQVLRLEGDRATPAANDEIYQSFYLSDSAGNQDEMGRIAMTGFDVTSTSEDGEFRFGIMKGGVFANYLYINGSQIRPATNDGLALGSSSFHWSDLFLASGGVINWNNGDVTLTHAANVLNLEGGSLGIASSSPNSLLTVGPSTANGTSTISMGKIQWDGYNSAGARICTYFVGTTLTAQLGACNQ